MNTITKDDIRAQVRKWRAELTPDWITTRSRNITEQFMNLPEYVNAETVCLYMAIAGEVRLDAIMEDCWLQGKQVLIPAYRKEHNDYGFKVANADTKMAPGLWDVPEPDTSEWSIIGSAKTCIAVPGIAFDDNGTRIGHGKGYYDRLLAFTKDKTDCTKVGICFDFQRIDNLPSEEWDIEMNIILSESRIKRSDNR